MGSLFAALAAGAGAANDAVMGEAVALLPRSFSEHKGAVVDPNRTAQTTRGTFTLKRVAEEELAGQRQGTQMHEIARLSLNQALLLIAAYYAKSLTWVPQQNDGVQLTDEAGAPTYNVEDCMPQDTGDLLLILTLEH